MARRLLGEALSQAGRMPAAHRGALDAPGLLRRLTGAHAARTTAVWSNN
ncbi:MULTISPECIES: hypothetical protein [unclassified Micromonospora]